MPRWAGPPPLLVAATVLGILVAPAVSRADADPGPDRGADQATIVSAPTATPTPTPAPSAIPPLGDSTPGSPESTDAPTTLEPTEKAKPKTPAPQDIGVASFNRYRGLTPAEADQDALALTSRPGVTIVGWQEAYSAGPTFQLLAEKGWATRRYVARKGMRELAVSWRRDRFTLVSSAIRKVADGVGQDSGRYPFGDRYALRVTLRDKASGELLSVLNTHLPQKVEDLDDLGTWRSTRNARQARTQLEEMARLWDEAPGRWVIGTGDYNIDARADARIRTDRGVRDTFDGVARSSYAELGFGSVLPTHPFTGRYIDYVLAAQPALDAGRVEFTGQRTFSGLSSDHRPLLVWLHPPLTLREPSADPEPPPERLLDRPREQTLDPPR